MVDPYREAYKGSFVIKRSHFFIILACLLLIGAILFFSHGISWGADMLSIAQSQIGLGELGGNNRGQFVRQYLNGREGLPWCAGFVSFCAKKSGLNIPYTLRAKDFMKLGQKVNKPQAGDLIVFSRQGGGHIGIVEKINKRRYYS